jgi:L-alanine-DL-glutamate epimerase-like enolase superfamily enzyme
MLTITGIDAWLCPMPMRHPVRLGAMLYRTRDYVVVRVRTDGGAVGRAIGYTRGTPLLEALRTLSIALDPAVGIDPRAVQGDLRARFMPGWASFVRAASLLDIALWDIRAQEAGLPMRTLLGDAEGEPAAMVVAGYFADVRSRRELLDEVTQLVERGATVVKVMVPGADVDDDVDLVREVSRHAAGLSTVGAEIAVAVDLHGGLRPFDPGAAEIARRFHDLGVAFIEDPFPGPDWRPVEHLVGEHPELRLAVGEDLVGLSGALDLLPSAHLLRVDATASGGLTLALDAIDAAERAGVGVAPHVFAPVHAPLAGRSSVVRLIETIPSLIGSDPLHPLLDSDHLLVDEIVWPSWPVDPDATGLDLPVDWDRVAAHATASWTLPVPGRRSE